MFSGKKCENGGTKSQNQCICQKYYTGSNCQWITCLNGGVNITSSDCSCSSNRYHGLHCQSTKCDNGGQDNGLGSCNCVKGWYSGKYCETYGSPWLIVFGVAGSILILLLICCLIYRFGCRSKCKTRNRHNHDVTPTRGSTHGRRRNGAQAARSQEETEPTMSINLNNSINSKPPEYKPETPPPSYELALSWSRENLDKLDNVDEVNSIQVIERNESNAQSRH